MTADRLSLAEAAALCADAGIGWFGPWRHKVAEVGAAEARRILDGHGLRVSSLCRGGFFLAADEAEDNRRAVEEAATLGTDVLVLVCGPPEGRDVDGARARIADGIERLLPACARARRAARDRAAAPDDDLRALRHRHARRGASTSPRGWARPRTSA